jgi:hypothetical protein
LTLVRTHDGKTFEKVATFHSPFLKRLTEATIRFKANGDAIAFIRAEKNGLIAQARIQDGYASWSTHVLPFRVGGPNFLFASTEKMIAGTRLFFLTEDNCLDEMTIIGSMDENSFIPHAYLTSSYDNSYPGMVLEDDGSVAVIYYSSEKAGTSEIFIQHVK